MADMRDFFVDMLTRIEELERRMECRRRTGTVHEVDLEKGLARVRISEDARTGEPYLSPWIPWNEPRMGHVKVHTMPEVGEQVTLVSESGDLTEASIDSSAPSNAFPRPSKGRELMITVGDKTSLQIREDGVTLKTPHMRTESGKIEYQNDNSSITPARPRIPMNQIPTS